ncbi:MAG: DEAD-like helicase [Herminiimonas sp.]|nr:DEAD-like helicase [Herminiimonas sp.]
MALDLSKLRGASLLDKEPNPREIFTLLAEKDPKYQYLRDVQAEVLEHWFERRREKDVVLKMNTGGGKTVVGLLLLKSCLNEGIAPAFFIVPDNYLLSQVENEAHLLGLPVEREPDSPAVLQGKAIGIINIHKLINGFSKFGVGDDGIKLPIGAVVVDDAHACMNSMESQFSIEVDHTHEVYANLLGLFRDDLRGQNESMLLEIEARDPGPTMLVPFWAWHQKSEQATRILSKFRNDDALKFNWPLIKSDLSHCRCVIGGQRLEISPRCLPIESIPSFDNAKRRIFMTATLADDSILVSDFKANPGGVTKHITPRSANDIGDRMILAPQEIDPNISEIELKEYLKEKSKKYNVVIIVGSEYRAESFWKDVADRICNKNNLETTVKELKAGHLGLVVLVNKYDGIDLPNAACRILVLDGLPKARRLIEKIENNFLGRSRHIIGRQVQRIEQGIGRGVRANDDYCVVLLMGAELTKVLFLLDAKDMFSPATRAQLNLAADVTKQLEGGMKDIDEAIDYCLNQDSAWKKLARECLVGVGYAEKGTVRSIAIAQREAFDASVVTNYGQAQKSLQKLLNSEKEFDSITRGWLMWQLAEYTQYTNPVEAQIILKAAVGYNRRLTKPLEGIDYEQLSAKDLEQSRNAVWKLRSYGSDSNKLLVDLNGVLEDLIFKPDTSKAFEDAMKEIAELIGFISQRPELDFNSGPDVLWAVGNLRYFVIECKNGAVTSKVSKDDCNQLTGSVNWFEQRYDHTCKTTPVLVHPANLFEFDASPLPETRVITEEGLHLFKEALRTYAKAVGEQIGTIEYKEVLQLLDHNNLTPDKFLNRFTKQVKLKK